MANELTLNLTVSFARLSILASMISGAKQFDVAGSDYVRSTMLVPTSVTALPLGSIGTAGYCMMVNRDATNYVEVYTAVAGAAAIKLKPGEWAVFRFATAAPAAKANTAAATVEYLIIED